MAEIITSTTASEARPSVRAALVAALVISAVTLGIATSELAMADWPSGFVLLVLVPLMALTFIGCGLWSMTLLLRIRRHGVKFAAPFLIYALTLATLDYAPLSEIALQRNFAWYRASRERIVARVEAGKLKPNVDYNYSLIALGDEEANVSAGGKDIVVDRGRARRHLRAVPDLARPEAHISAASCTCPRARTPTTSSSSTTSRRACSCATTRIGISWRTRLSQRLPAYPRHRSCQAQCRR